MFSINVFHYLFDIITYFKLFERGLSLGEHFGQPGGNDAEKEAEPSGYS